MPGYGLTLGYTLTYLSLVVLIPLAGLLLRPVSLGWQGFWRVVLEPRVLAALELSYFPAQKWRGWSVRENRAGGESCRVGRIWRVAPAWRARSQLTGAAGHDSSI